MNRSRFGAAARAAAAAFAFSVALGAPRAEAAQFFRIDVRDKDTHAPLGCAKLTTTGSVVYTSDANGVIAFYEPGLMGRSVYFFIERAGYSYPADGFGYAGQAFTPTEGGSALVEMTRVGAPGACNPGTDDSLLVAGPVPTPAQHFRIDVVDADTGRGVPLVELRSPKRTFVSDSWGLVAFHDPQAMGAPTTFEVFSHGYGLAAGGASVTLTTTPGGRGFVTVRRRPEQIAQRLYRLTGGGDYRDSVLLGLSPPTASPLLNGLVTGQDSVQSAVYKGKAFYVWGDTNRPSYPLGNFKASGATSPLTGPGALDPEVGVNLAYFVDETGFSKQMAPSATVPNPQGESGFLAAWLGALIAAPNAAGQERLFALYSLVGGGFNTRETGIVRFNDYGAGPPNVFEKAAVLAGPGGSTVLGGHAHTLRHGAAKWIYYDSTARTAANEASLLNPATYQTYTPFAQGSSTVLDRDAEGRIRYAWRTGTPILAQSHIDAGVPAAPEERLFGHNVEPDTGHRPALAALGSGAWNPYRGRFQRIVQEAFGATSLIGELWWSEADTPMGPWVYARKIITHDDYSFYNPRIHPFMSKRGGRDLFVDGTYTSWLSGSEPTPRYDYNQLLYKVELDDARLLLPVPVYDRGGATPGDFATKAGLRRGEATPPAPFFAWDREAPGAVALWWVGAECGVRRLIPYSPAPIPPVFYALPADAESPPAETLPLYEYADGATGKYAYSVEEDLALPGFVRAEAPIARVWRNPLAVTLPATDYLADLIADAGPDQCLQELVRREGLDVRLDGARSSHAAGGIVSYAWSWSGGQASGVSPTIHLPAGNTVVQLTATDAAGATSTDHAVIAIKAAPGSCGTLDAGEAPRTALALLLAPLGLLARARRRSDARR